MNQNASKSAKKQTTKGVVLTSGNIRTLSSYKAAIIGVLVANILLMGAPWLISWLLSFTPGPGFNYLMLLVLLPMAYVGGAINLIIVMMVMPRTFTKWHPSKKFIILGSVSLFASIIYAVFCVSIYFGWFTPIVI